MEDMKQQVNSGEQIYVSEEEQPKLSVTHTTVWLGRLLSTPQDKW
jgi:hypothetical protein